MDSFNSHQKVGKKMLKKTQIAKISGVSKSYVSKVISGEINSSKAELIKILLELKQEDFYPLIADEIFLELCNVAIMRAKNIEVRKRAVLLHEMAIKLMEKYK